jgi:hypothetical protein
MRNVYHLEGPRSVIEALEAELPNEPKYQFTFEERGVVADNAINRRPMGMEPFTYLIIAITGHLTAELLHDLLKDKLSSDLLKKITSIKIRRRGTDSDQHQ